MRKGNKYQRGYILPLSLVIMAFGILVVGSLLSYVGANVNTRAIARDNLKAYYAADAGIQVIIAKLIQADYKENEDGEPDEDGELFPLPDRTYPTDDMPIDVDILLDNEINGHKVTVTVEYEDMLRPDYVIYKITAYANAYNPETGDYDLADKVIAIVSQEPYPLPVYEGIGFRANIISWQRQ